MKFFMQETLTAVEFQNNLRGLGTKQEQGYCTDPPEVTQAGGNDAWAS